MPKKDPRIDVYIQKSAPFAKPVLNRLRKLVHGLCPEVTETVKWGMPHFEYKGVLFGMAAFKQHCAVHFWKGDLIVGDAPVSGDAMGHLGRLASLGDLPDAKTLTGYIKKAVELNEAGVKKPARARPKTRTALVVPEDLQAALRKERKALTTFDGFSYSHQKEYVEWITEAKRDETRARRLETAVAWLAQGKSRNWKYQR